IHRQLELVKAVQERLPMIRASMPTRTLRTAALARGALDAPLSPSRVSGTPKKASGGCKRAEALHSSSRSPVRSLGTRRKELGKQNRRLINRCQRQTSYRRSTQSSFSLPLSSCITTTVCMIPVHSSLTPTAAYPTILPTLSLSSTPPRVPDLPLLHPPPLLFVLIPELALRSRHCTVLGPRGRGVGS
ncbi:hypothetical protein BKA70DRAFT_1344440, partial [Coprinopsis sp. MPI-PUGE-AT-0042]